MSELQSQQQQHIIELEKLTSVEPTPLNQCQIGCFIDNSGSTCTLACRETRGNKNILDVEKQFISKFPTVTQCVMWNSDAKVYSMDRIHNCNPTGGTYPTTIFNDSGASKLFTTSNVIVFTTDGEISTRDVTSFAEQLNNRLDKTLIICALFSPSNLNTQVNNEDPDISVFAPFLLAKNVLIVQCTDPNAECVRVLHSAGNIASQFEKSTNVKVAELTRIEITDNYPTIPEGYLFLSETPTHVRAFNMANFLHQEEFDGQYT